MSKNALKKLVSWVVLSTHGTLTRAQWRQLAVAGQPQREFRPTRADGGAVWRPKAAAMLHIGTAVRPLDGAGSADLVVESRRC